ncbi:hypothetical protein [Pseudoduganella lutea]|uniref:PEP-CTERM sorting domain-containing protein n=1 Tax=Pseudoduganella lutea TaxID=321985 RepID=A0A4P6KU74_9BURK|nr:hypothetical protein [Pseudoduganella lutea]QBE62649.1 hypothetical protein EWM63_06425 [Pseudoduganella lutea]
MMKILRAVAFATAASAATVHAAPEPAAIATWHMADVHDVTQAWYFTGEALSGPSRDGAPWAEGQPSLRPAANTTLAPAPPVVPAVPSPPVPARVEVPSTLPEPDMASMLLVGLALIFLRINRKEDVFG